MEIITEKNFKDKTKEGVCVVDFFATWCGPCKMLAPILEEVQSSFDGKMYKVDVDEDYDLATSFGIMSVPTVLFFRDGVLKEQFSGLRSMEDIESILKKI